MPFSEVIFFLLFLRRGGGGGGGGGEWRLQLSYNVESNKHSVNESIYQCLQSEI